MVRRERKRGREICVDGCGAAVCVCMDGMEMWWSVDTRWRRERRWYE